MRAKPCSRSGTFQFAKCKGNTRLVLLSLADRADLTGFCWPGYEDIMRRANCSRAVVANALKDGGAGLAPRIRIP
jgi:Helix-turn-helix domain